MTRTSLIRSIKIIASAFAALLIIAFAVWRSLDYARGPKVTISLPTNGAEITAKYVTVKGRVERANDLLINGKEINVDEHGNFSDNIVVFPGINVITVTAKDQFGRSVKDQLTLIGNDGSSSTSLTN